MAIVPVTVDFTVNGGEKLWFDWIPVNWYVPRTPETVMPALEKLIFGSTHADGMR